MKKGNNVDWQLAYSARKGKIQLRKVRYGTKGKSQVEALTDWLEPIHAFAAMGRYANALLVSLQAIRDSGNEQAARALDGITFNGSSL